MVNIIENLAIVVAIVAVFEQAKELPTIARKLPKQAMQAQMEIFISNAFLD